jgi:putative membrane protein
MNRVRFTQAACETLSDCVKEIEHVTDAELVIIVRARSGHYAHADYLCGFIVALVVLLFVLFSPFTFHQIWVPFDVALAFAGGAFLCSRTNFLRRIFSTSGFRRQAVRQAASSMFYEAGIANTNAEMGILIYLSLFEKQLELIADRGVLKRVPSQDWNRQLFELHQAGGEADPQKFQEALRTFGELLSKHIPPTGENPNELPDMPRFELK